MVVPRERRDARAVAMHRSHLLRGRVRVRDRVRVRVRVRELTPTHTIQTMHHG